MLKAIETRYNGYRFRSRLEARWAVFFDTLGVKYEYESEGFELGDGLRYLPDFWLPDYTAWVEIKPGEPMYAEQEKMGSLLLQSKRAVFCFGGTPGEHKVFNAQWQFGCDPIAIDDPQWADHMAERQLIAQEFDQLYDVLLRKPAKPFWGLTNRASTMDYPAKWGEVLHCPMCQAECVNIAQSRYVESQTYTAWAGQGDALYVPMRCDANCEWDLRIGFHKGNTFMGIENATTVCTFDWILAGCDDEKLEKAINAARSARFEFGENGR